jgi:hypothetical protein
VVFSRPRLSLDGTWSFVADPEQRLEPDRLPDGVAIEVPSCWEAQLGPAAGHVTGWYRRTFEVPDAWSPGRTILRFGAVSYRADVWLNGTPLGGHEGAYTRFELCADGAIRTGSNELVVRVVNPAGALMSYPILDPVMLDALDPASPDLPIGEIPIGKQTWYSSLSGIWRSVELERRGPLAIASVGVTPDVRAGVVSVRWTREADAAAAASGSGIPELRLTVSDADGAVVAVVSVDDPGVGGERSVAIPEPRLWDLDDPHRYRLAAELLVAGEVVDRVEVRFGMRTVDTADGMVRLNGRPRYVRGVLDQDVHDGTLWRARSRDELEATFRRVKAMGLNVLRCHIKVPDPVYLELADEIGLLVWAELPSWGRLTEASGDRARATLREMVDQLGHHPSIAIWTIVNENWGTDLIHDAAHRSWLRETFDWLKELDPSRLAVDNSACWTPDGGNFHLSTDIADYHVYFAMPDHADRWRAAIADFAARPAWLWSPHGDASPSGDEPLILSEFGNWGLPRLDARPGSGAEGSPWWASTGLGPARPDGALERFAEQGLGRVAPDGDGLTDAAQWHQFDAMQFEIGELRRHASIAGYVVTELSDAFWEPNGLLNLDRSDKAFGASLVDLFGADTVFVDLERWDLWTSDVLSADVNVTLEASPRDRSLTVTWRLSGLTFEDLGGTVELTIEPGSTTASSRLVTGLPALETAVNATLTLDLVGGDGGPRAHQEYRLVLAPAALRTTARPCRVAMSGDVAATPVGRHIVAIGHVIDADGDILVTDRLDAVAVAFADRGGTVLAILAAAPATGFPWVTGSAAPADPLPSRPRALDRPVSVQSRYGARDPRTGRPLNLEGDWISAFAWIDPGLAPALPARALLDFAYRDVLPDQVLLGADPEFAKEVIAGSFVGWLADPAAHVWSFAQGPGRITATTWRLGSDGPVAAILLDALIQTAAGAAGDPVGAASS